LYNAAELRVQTYETVRKMKERRGKEIGLKGNRRENVAEN